MAVNKAASAATKVVDQFAGSIFGGQLVKAKLVIFKNPDLDKPPKDGWLKGDDEITFFLNPSSISVTKTAKTEKDSANQGQSETKFVQTEPTCLTIGELWFDTYDTRESVREQYIDKLEALLDYVPDTHVLPVVSFVWGKFSQDTENGPNYAFFVTKLNVDYTMFLPDATPVRAKVKLGLEQATTKAQENARRQKKSPDHAKLYTVKRGDTLQAIAQREYEDPREWRRIAKTNNIDDPMALRPGTKLLVPPILK